MTQPRPSSEADLIERIRSLDDRAPAELHARVATMVDERARAWRRSPSRVIPVIGARRAVAASLLATAATILVVVLALGGGSTAPDLRTAAALTLRPPTLAAPVESSHNGSMLEARVDGVAFPYWEESFGWRASGARVDRVGGRLMRTVFYSDAHGRRIGYTIVGGTPPASVAGGTTVTRDGRPYHVLDVGGAEVVAWLRSGRLCVVSGRGIDSATLVRLASWQERRGVAA